MKRKAYRATAVNRVSEAELVKGREGQTLVVGMDQGKFEHLAVARWPDGQLERPWRVASPEQVPELVDLLRRLAQGRSLTVALEPSGTYGDPLRQAVNDAGIAVVRVSPKAAHDYAEVFDGVPSQHDGKDAAVVAELAALGKSTPWPYEVPARWEQEVACCVDWMDAQQSLLTMWLGRLEALLARHWPEATRVLKKLSSATLLHAVAAYGSPAALAADEEAETQLAAWGGYYLKADKRQRLLASAAGSIGVRCSDAERAQLMDYAEQALQARAEVRHAQQRLRRLVKDQPVLQAMGRAVGIATACVLWAHLGDPRHYSSGPAYRKAMGLNLVERSSGIYQGKLKISRRGHGQVRRWLYFSVLRLARRELRTWYQDHKSKEGHDSKRVLIGIMRRLALAVYQVGAHQAIFDVRKLFPGTARGAAQPVIVSRR
jgi:transposase